MPPKRKDFLKPKGKLKTKAQDPQSENDFLEAADEFEQAAGKWRAGDAAKATRFFNRAIDMYNEGLKRWPKSFDLAYNKANLEYKITEDERIISQMGNKTALLEETLASHRFATSLNPDNTDVQFNTAQVLTSLAEALLESSTQEEAKAPARSLLEEAVGIFTRCLERQERDYEQIQTELIKAQAEAEEQGEFNEAAARDQDDMETSSTASDGPGEWATVEEPLTPETILETCIAQLGAMTTLIGLHDPPMMGIVDEIAKYGIITSNTKIPIFLDQLSTYPFKKAEEPKAGPTLSIGNESESEDTVAEYKRGTLLAVSDFQNAIAEMEYRSGRTDVKQYAATIRTIGERFKSDVPENNPAPSEAFADYQALYANALMDFASAVFERVDNNPGSPSLSTDLAYAWDALTQAQDLSTRLSTGAYTSILPPSRLSRTFLDRGDIDLFRFRISFFESAKPAWVNSRAVLVANAGVFYRGARSYAENAGDAETRDTADAKAIIAEVLKEVSNGSNVRKDHWKGRSADVGVLLEQMVEEGILGRENVEGLMSFLN